MDTNVRRFDKVKFALDGVEITTPIHTCTTRTTGPPIEEPTWDDLFRIAEEEAQTIGMHTDKHPEGTLAWGCRLWIGDRVVVAAEPSVVCHYIQGIKIAIGMVARGEISGILGA